MHTTTTQGLPNSSSQCIVGGIVGVGMLEGTTGVNWRFMGALWVDRGSGSPPDPSIDTTDSIGRPINNITISTPPPPGVTFASWAVTLFIMGGGTALLFAQGIFAPCVDKRG